MILAIDAYACRCEIYSSIETHLKERYEASDFVILAKIESVKDSLTKGDNIMAGEKDYWRHGGYNPVLKISKVYKGKIKADTIEITPNWSNCSQYFKKGDTYVIFGYINQKGEYTTSMCSANFPSAREEWWKQFQKMKKKKT